MGTKLVSVRWRCQRWRRIRPALRAIWPEHTCTVQINVRHFGLCSVGLHVQEHTDTVVESLWDSHFGRTKQGHRRPSHFACSACGKLAYEIICDGEDDARDIFECESVCRDDGVEKFAGRVENGGGRIFLDGCCASNPSQSHDSMNPHHELRLVAIAGPPVLEPGAIVSACQAAETGGVTAVQLRWKNATPRDLVQVATHLVATLSVPVFLNDRPDVAWGVRAFGVHLAANDLPLDGVRRQSPAGFCLGVSIGDEDEARSASGAGADYWSIGPVHETDTKQDAGPALGIEGFERLAGLAPGGMPVLAIGGINVSNVAAVMAAGAHGVAVSHGVFGDRDIVDAARRLRVAVDGAECGRP